MLSHLAGEGESEGTVGNTWVVRSDRSFARRPRKFIVHALWETRTGCVKQAGALYPAIIRETSMDLPSRESTAYLAFVKGRRA